ncbi:MAG: hypothetical protein WC635_05175 [Bacteriovorax sp.]|jgi:hypothetical protein
MIFLIIFIAFFPPVTRAAGGPICDTIFRSSNVGCDDQASSNTSGGSYPLLFDAFNFNPSALPTFPTPTGVEGYYTDKKLNVALIKGTQNVGFGASSKKSNTTFFSGSENYKVALNHANPAYKSSTLNQYINLGSALNILKIPEIASLPFGLSYRYSPETKKWTFNPGAEIRTAFLSLGASYNKEIADKYNDSFSNLQEERENFLMNANLKLSNLLLGYSLIHQKNTIHYFFNSLSVTSSTIYTISTHIYSGTMVTSKFSFTAAYRQQNDSRIPANYADAGYKKSHILGGAAYKTERLELGGFYNYVLNEDISFLVKLFF